MTKITWFRLLANVNKKQDARGPCPPDLSSDFNDQCGYVQEDFQNFIKHSLNKMPGAITSIGKKLFSLSEIRKNSLKEKLSEEHQ